MNSIIAFIRNLFASSAVATANRAVATYNADGERISDAERLLADLKTQRQTNAAASAAALTEALANAKSDAERADIRRNAEIEAQNDKTDKVIAALEEAIANAKEQNSVKLGKIAVKHKQQRAAEAADQQTATDALELVRSAAGAPSAE